MRVLVLNCGSSSLKFSVLDVSRTGEEMLERGVEGHIQGIGGSATLELRYHSGTVFDGPRPVVDYSEALQWAFDTLASKRQGTQPLQDLMSIEAVGHRIVHGGSRFCQSVRIDADILRELEELADLAPLHNQAGLAGIMAARAALGESLPMIAVFDTTFHRTIPQHARLYAIPYALSSEHQIERYGFHGIAHASLAAGYSTLVGKSLAGTRLVTVQLGSGCSATALLNGRSVDTSMGFTPLEGLIMGTRSGDVDPSLIRYLMRKENLPIEDVERQLNTQSGLLGISGRTQDMRELLKLETDAQEAQARLAVTMFCYRVQKYIGAYLATLLGADAVIFGGGIGENAPDIRARVCSAFDWCGLELDEARNRAAVGLNPGDAVRISSDASTIEVVVVATDEASVIARETVRCL